MSTFILLVSFLSFDGSVSVDAYDFQSLEACQEAANVLLNNGAFETTCVTTK